MINTNYDLAGWISFINETGATTASFINPTTAPDVASYHASIGGTASEASFLSTVRQQSRQNWDDRYMAEPVIAYLRLQLSLPLLSGRGDINGDGSVNVPDVFYLISYLFSGGPQPIGPGDVNADGQVAVGDIFFLINYLFSGGPTP